MPAAHRAHKDWTPERLIHWGAGIGPDTGHFVTQLLQRFRHPEHGYRSCLGLLSLATGPLLSQLHGAQYKPAVMGRPRTTAE